ncbi:MAG TPA: hypothetical protein VEI01_19400 [Terriglobales bacterium]|nr:hypothetical protein [Terriglobales bacterium]
MKIKFDRVISVATLAASLTAIVLVMKKPSPVAPPLPPAAVAANAQSFQSKIDQLDQARVQGQSGAEVHLSGDEVTAAIAQASVSASPAPAAPSSAKGEGGEPNPLLAGELGPGQPDIQNYQVNFQGDLVTGQFLTKIAGKDVWVTVSGHLGSKDGYATFEPTEFKVGDLNVPVSLVNDQLQKRLLEQRGRLKLPDSVGGVKVENGELVLSNK